MTELTLPDIATALDALLDEERTALLTGVVNRIEDVMQRKVVLIDALSDHGGHDVATISALQAKLERNQVLFDQALAGIHNVASRLTALRRLCKTLKPCDERGRKSILFTPEDNTLRRCI